MMRERKHSDVVVDSRSRAYGSKAEPVQGFRARRTVINVNLWSVCVAHAVSLCTPVHYKIS